MKTWPVINNYKINPLAIYLLSGLSFWGADDVVLLNMFLKKIFIFLTGYQISETKKVTDDTKKAIIIDIAPPSIPGPKYKYIILSKWLLIKVHMVCKIIY
ncbi:hypothetical protein HDF24_07300 [Mucilaginibacter sp. X4EP1]|uniref:hypothetical protein n=1 Tax=Mucilaginibacter sp. X4EP1 TaxID=2723092 RepID=UPI002169C90F|nr:hypothetical protein [Mucilaginibacter sp. X4EP1]MCS3814116.1 hypothetical protein [Mucilaginibacter sp. X4EP1]